ncbi:MAG TPA: polysaccharide deacetylase family protein [Pseudonocardiaceae bacterium]
MRYRVFRPPYVYRWAGLIGGSAMVVTLVTLAVGLIVPLLVGDPPAGAQAATAERRPGPGDPPPAARARAGARPHRPVVPVSADIVAHVARPDRVVALTFDDGPSPDYTPQVLALLARYHVVATFCMIGPHATRYPELVRTVVADGMGLCDHTVSHDEHLWQLPQVQIEAEIIGGRADVRNSAGPDAPIDYFRAPGGRWSDPVRQIAAHNGMKPLSWSLDPRDWSRPGADRIVATVQQQVHPGAVILLHDGGGRRDQTIAALAQLLPWLIAQGYQFVLP